MTEQQTTIGTGVRWTWRAAFIALALSQAAVPARGEILGALEGPTVGAQVSNVQGWAFTTTPGARLIQPFQVRIDGVDAMLVPCCSDRGDVQAVHPTAPRQTGFSGVFNWGLLGGGGDFVSVEVIVEDTKGGRRMLKRTVPIYALSDDIPFFHDLSVNSGLPPGSGLLRSGRCEIGNNPIGDTTGLAEIRCYNVTASRQNPDGFPIARSCDALTFGWDRSSQSFVQTSDCLALPRWSDNGNGTATDNHTGLVWELKTEDGTVHDVDRVYTFSVDGARRSGTAYTEFLDELNSSVSTDGRTGSGCFAGECDWRLPTIDELREIHPDVGAAVCGSECVPIPGETAEATYWSSTAASDPLLAWLVDFETGESLSAGSFGGNRVRAVRGTRERSYTPVL